MSTLINIYRPPYSAKHKYTLKSFLEEFEEFLAELYDQKGTVFIVGDININVNRHDDSNVEQFLRLLEINNLQQFVKTRTHVKGGIIDLVITEKTFTDIIVKVDESYHTDHYPIGIQIPDKTTCVNVVLTKQVREIYKLDQDEFSKDLQHEPLVNPEFFSKLTVDDLVSKYNSTLKRLFDLHCPLKVKKYRSNHVKSRWYNSSLQDLKQKRRQKERKFLKCPSSYNKTELKRARNRYNFEIKQTRSKFYHQQLTDSASDSKKFFKSLNKLIGNVKERTIPAKDDDYITAEKMSEFYVSKINKIRSGINSINSSSLPEELVTPNDLDCFQFSPINLQELEKIILSMNNKSCIADPVPTTIVKQNLKTLLPVLQFLINSCIIENIFPNELKCASITPILKDPSKDADDFKNLRPISNLPFPSKLLEKVMYSQLNHHVESNQLMCKYQSAYRKHHSCETAMFRILGDIQEMLSEQSYVALVLLDSSAAFDTVDHALLLHRLKHQFRVGEKALKLITSFLSNRSFRIVLNDIIGSATSLKHGVPQGSVLGPLFYALYTDNIESIVEKHKLQVHLYADDVQIYFCFKPEHRQIQERNLQDCINSITAWMNESFLKLNPDKTKIKLFVPRKNTLNSASVTLSNENLVIEPVNTVIVLGVTLGSGKLTGQFISKKISVCNFHLRNLRSIRDCLPQKTKILVVKNMIISQLDYCNSLLLCSPFCDISPLQRILNKAVRFIFNLRRFDRTSPFLFKLHVLPVTHRIRFKACLLAHNIVYKKAPLYMQDKFLLFEPTTSMEFRSGIGRDRLMFQVNLQQHKSGNLYSKVITEWNSLPLALRNIQSIETFKPKLKAIFFKEAFAEFL